MAENAIKNVTKKKRDEKRDDCILFFFFMFATKRLFARCVGDVSTTIICFQNEFTLRYIGLMVAQTSSILVQKSAL